MKLNSILDLYKYQPSKMVWL